MFMHDIIKSILPYYYFKVIHSFERKSSWFFLYLFISQMKDLMNAKLILKNNISWCAAYGCSNSSKNNPGKTFFLLPKNECTRKVLIAAIGGSLPKNVYLCFNIILNKLVSKKAGHCKHNFLDITSLFRYISKIFISVVKQLCYVITFL